jgi:hypothetical protein
MERGISLASWYVGEALRLDEGGRTDPALVAAKELLSWLQAQPQTQVSFRSILQLGPRTMRTKATAEMAVAALISHRWITETQKRPRAFQVIKHATVAAGAER